MLLFLYSVVNGLKSLSLSGGREGFYLKPLSHWLHGSTESYRDLLRGQDMTLSHFRVKKDRAFLHWPSSALPLSYVTGTLR
jgi:hypothetical protein